MGAGAPCFTVFVASIVLSAPCGMILFEDVGTINANKNITAHCISSTQKDVKAFDELQFLRVHSFLLTRLTHMLFKQSTLSGTDSFSIPMNSASKSKQLSFQCIR